MFVILAAPAPAHRPQQPAVQNSPDMVRGTGRFCTACAPRHVARAGPSSRHSPLAVSDTDTGGKMAWRECMGRVELPP